MVSPVRANVARLVACGAVLCVLVAASLALAQPHGRPLRKPKAGAPSSEASGDAAGAATPSVAVGGATDAGTVPLPPGEQTADGGSLSPLNPAANEFSDAGWAPQAEDYDRLLADIASLRARVAAVSDALFHSRIGIAIETSGEHARVAALSVSLDDGVVWTAPASFLAEDSTVVYDHAVAPGHHAVTVEVERRDDRGDVFRSSERSRFIVDVPPDQKLSVELRLEDDSNMGADFSHDRRGQYELRIRLRARAQTVLR
jgi:hypothetical protein